MECSSVELSRLVLLCSAISLLPAIRSVSWRQQDLNLHFPIGGEFFHLNYVAVRCKPFLLRVTPWRKTEPRPLFRTVQFVLQPVRQLQIRFCLFMGGRRFDRDLDV